MATKNIKLPAPSDGVSDVVRIEELKTERARHATDGKRIDAQLAVIKEVLVVGSEIVKTIRAHRESTVAIAKYDAEVKKAEFALDRARAELVESQNTNNRALRELDLLEERQRRVLSLFDLLLEGLKYSGLEVSERDQQTQRLLDLSDKLVAIGR